MTTRALRICVVGDELAAGVGDPRALGWVGRVAARTHAPATPAFFTLAVPGEATTDLASRWETETSSRFAPGYDNRLVIALGRADADNTGSLARSRLNLANILDVAVGAGLGVFVVGPPPGPAEIAKRLAELSAAWHEVAHRRGIAYVDCYRPLRDHEQWLSDMAAGDGVHPGQAGYGLMTWLVLHNGWHNWLGLPTDIG